MDTGQVLKSEPVCAVQRRGTAWLADLGSSPRGRGGAASSPHKHSASPTPVLSSHTWLGCNSTSAPTNLRPPAWALARPLCLWCPLLLPGPRGSQTPEREQSLRPKQNEFFQTPAEPALLRSRASSSTWPVRGRAAGAEAHPSRRCQQTCPFQRAFSGHGTGRRRQKTLSASLPERR